MNLDELMAARRSERAAARVCRFLVVRSGMGGVDLDVVYTVGDPETGDVLELRTDDLVELVRGVLGDDAPVVDPVRQARMRDGRTAAGRLLGQALRDGKR